MKADFQAAVNGVKNSKRIIEEFSGMMQTIYNYREQHRHDEVPPLVRSTFKEVNLPIPSEWQDPKAHPTAVGPGTKRLASHESFGGASFVPKDLNSMNVFQWLLILFRLD